MTSIGITVNAVQPLPDELPPEAWVVLAGDVEQVMLCGDSGDTGKSPADEADEKTIVAWLKQSIRPGHKLISICTGALLAARWTSRWAHLHYALSQLSGTCFDCSKSHGVGRPPLCRGRRSLFQCRNNRRN
jgi:hypothetical protein